MPPRWVVAAVVAGWLAAVGWLAHDVWLPWLRPADEPAFVVEVADQVAPEHYSWSIYRGDKRVGGAETRFAPLSDGRFELTTRLRDLELRYGEVARFRFTAFAVTRHVAADGRLLSLDGKGGVQAAIKGRDVKLDAHVRRRADDGLAVGGADFDLSGARRAADLDPVRLVSRNVLVPLQPGQKYPPLRPGQSWRATHIDPVAEAMDGAGQIAMSEWVPGAPPARFGIPARAALVLAEVQPDTEVVTTRDGDHTCREIRFRGDRVKVRTWVDVADGRVVRQEADYDGDVIRMQRD